MAGIVSYGAYIPFYRLPISVINKAWGRGGGQGEKAICNFDEDSLTMMVAAGLDCLKGIDPKSIDGLYTATTTSPYTERQVASLIATALDLRTDIRTADFANSLRAGTTALAAACDAVNSGAARSVLVLAGDSRMGECQGEMEQQLGDGAGAILVGKDKVIADITQIHSISYDFPDHWRATGDEFVRSWEDRWGVDEGYMVHQPEAMKGVLKKAKLESKDVTKAVFYGTTARRHAELGRKAGLTPEQTQNPNLDKIGNTGAAQVIMTLVGALEEAKAGQTILVTGYGDGSDAFIVKANGGSVPSPRAGIAGNLKNRKTLESYEKFLRWRELVPLARASRPERIPNSQATIWRERKQIMGLYGHKCKKCGTPQLMMDAGTLRSRACVICQSRDLEDYRFADKKATIFTFTQDQLAAGADPPNTITVVDFEGGGRSAFEMTDREPSEVKVGGQVEMTFRRMFENRGMHAYFWKTRPAKI